MQNYQTRSRLCGGRLQSRDAAEINQLTVSDTLKSQVGPDCRWKCGSIAKTPVKFTNENQLIKYLPSFRPYDFTFIGVLVSDRGPNRPWPDY